MDLEPLAVPRGEGATDPHPTVDRHGRLTPIDLAFSSGDLRRVDRIADLGLGLTKAIGERSNELVGADLDQPPSQLVERLVIADRGLRAAVHSAGVEFDVEIHQTHAGGRIACEDRPLDGSGTAPARQERKVKVHERKPAEHRLRDEVPVRDHHCQIGLDLVEVGQPVGHGQPEFERRRLQRRGHPLRSTAAAGVGPRHDERDLIAGIDKSPERRNGQARRTQVDDPPDDVRRRSAHGVVVLTAG